MADLHNVDAVGRPRGQADVFSANVVAGPAKLVALDGRHNKTLNPTHPHSKSQQLHGEGLACPRGAQQHQVGVFVNLGVEQVHNAQGVVVPVDPQQHSVVVGHLKTAKGIGGSCPAGEYVPPGLFLQGRVDLEEGHHRAQGRLLLDFALADENIHGLEQVDHLALPPLEFLQGLGGDGEKYAEIEQVLVVVGNAIFDEVSRLDGVLQLLVVGAGVLHPFELGTVQADPLGHLVNGLAPVFPAEEQIHVNAFPGVDEGGYPARPDPAGIAVPPDHQHGVVPAVHDGVAGLGEVDAPWGQKIHHRDLRHRVQAQSKSLGGHGIQHHPVHTGLKGLGLAGAPVEDLVEDLRRGLVRVFRLDNTVSALEKVGPGGLFRPLEGSANPPVIPVIPAQRFILEDEKEPAGQGLPIAHIPDQPQVILPQGPALWIFLPRQLLLHQGDMLIRVRPAGDGLKLQPDGGDLQPAGKAGDNIELFLRRAQRKIDGLHLQDFQIPAVRGLHHAVSDVPDGQERLGRFPFTLLPFGAFWLCVFLCHTFLSS